MRKGEMMAKERKGEEDDVWEENRKEERGGEKVK